jgi:hypothetical protein
MGNSFRLWLSEEASLGIETDFIPAATAEIASLALFIA